MLGKSRRNERPLGDELIAAGELGEEDQHIEADKRERDDRERAPLAVVVADRKHAGFRLFCSPCGRDHSQARGKSIGQPAAQDAEGGFSATVRERMTHGPD